MRRLTRSGSLIVLLLWIAFIPMWATLPTHVLFEVLNGLCISTAAGTAISFWSGVWLILARPFRSWVAGDMLVLGVFILAVGLIGTFAGLWLYRVTGAESYHSDVLASGSRWLLVTAMLMHLIASGSDDGKIPPKAYRKAGVVVAIGCAAALLIVSMGM